MSATDNNLDAYPTVHATFSQRTTTWLPLAGDSASSQEQPEDYDFLSFITYVADLYVQEGVLEMRPGNIVSKVHSAGATSEVSRVTAAFTQPSTSTSFKLRRRVRTVIIKRSRGNLFHPNGQPWDERAARSLVMELRVLSHPIIRQVNEIVTLLGIDWDMSSLGSPEPILILEYANYNLKQFQSLYASLPFQTKISLATDIAIGLAALHHHGIIHGDIKPENILIFKNEEQCKAKIADFGHSLLDNGVERYLPGGTQAYAAPEWKCCAPTNLLRQTDIYSYGLVFASLIIGFDVPAHFINQFVNNNTETEDVLERFKQDDCIIGEILNLAFEVNNKSPHLLIDNPGLVINVLNLTLKKVPMQRDLQEVIIALSTRSFLPQKVESLAERYGKIRLIIPYQPLEPMSGVLKDQVIRALQQVATSSVDARRVAACFELCVCYASSFGANPSGIADTTRNTKLAIKWLKEAAEQGDARGRLAILPIHQALGEKIDINIPLTDWLLESASKGSWRALAQLANIDHGLYKIARQGYRSTFCGNSFNEFESLRSSPDYGRIQTDQLLQPCNARGDTILHYAASIGNSELLAKILAAGGNSSVLNAKNCQGDTALLCAARAGQNYLIKQLVDAGASSNIANNLNETPLHFICEFEDESILETAQMLVHAGAHINVEATGSSLNDVHSLKPGTGGSPMLRAVTSNNPLALKVLFTLKDSLKLDRYNRFQSSDFEFRLLLAYALKLHHIEILDILETHLDLLGPVAIENLRFWNNGRLRSLTELCLLGGVSSNPGSGFNWPEDFWRKINFGSNYLQALHRSLNFLNAHGTNFVDESCGEDAGAIAFAVRHGRRDALSWIISDMQSASSDLLWARVPFGCCTPVYYWTVSHEDDDSLSHEDDGSLNVQQNSLGFQHRLQSSHLENSNSDCHKLPYQFLESDTFKPSALISDQDARTNHRAKASLIAIVELAILHGQREIFYDLICHEDGLAVDPGMPREIAIMISTDSGWRTRILGKDNKPERFLEQSKLVDCRHLLPPPSGNYAIFSPLEKRKSWNPGAKDMYHVLNSTLNYFLLYMTSISKSAHRDIALAQILLTTLSERGKEKHILWKSQHWLESACLSYFSGQPVLSPLLHAVNSGWDEMTRLLLRSGASPQDGFWDVWSKRDYGYVSAFRKLLSMRPLDTIQNLLVAAADEKVERIITSNDLDWLICNRQWGFLNSGHRISWCEHGNLLEWRSWCSDGNLLGWRSSDPGTRAQIGLWQAIIRANEVQKSYINRRSRRDDLVLEAAIRQDFWAIKALLEMNFHPDAGYSVFRKPLFWKQLQKFDFGFPGYNNDLDDFYITPLDVVHWTSLVPDEQCAPTGRALKQHNRIIAALIREHGGTHGLEYRTSFHFLIRPLLHCAEMLLVAIGLTILVMLCYFLFVLLEKASWDRFESGAREWASSSQQIPLGFDDFLVTRIAGELGFLSTILSIYHDKWVAAIPMIMIFFVPTGRILGNSFVYGAKVGALFDILAFVVVNIGIFIAVFILQLLFMMAKSSTFGHFTQLAYNFHGGNTKVALKAMHSPPKGLLFSLVRLSYSVFRLWHRRTEYGNIRLEDHNTLLYQEETEAPQLSVSSAEERNLQPQREEQRGRRHDSKWIKQIRDFARWLKKGRRRGLEAAEYIKKGFFIISYPIRLVWRISDIVAAESRRQEYLRL